MLVCLISFFLFGWGCRRWRDSLQDTSLPAQPGTQCPQTHAHPVPRLLVVVIRYRQQGIVQARTLPTTRWAQASGCTGDGMYRLCARQHLSCLGWSRHPFTRWLVLILTWWLSLPPSLAHSLTSCLLQPNVVPLYLFTTVTAILEWIVVPKYSVLTCSFSMELNNTELLR